MARDSHCHVVLCACPCKKKEKMHGDRCGRGRRAYAHNRVDFPLRHTNSDGMGSRGVALVALVATPLSEKNVLLNYRLGRLERKAPINARLRQSGRDKRYKQGSGINANKRSINANKRKRNYSSVCSMCKAAANRVPRLVYTGPPKGMWVFMSGATE